MFFRCLVPVKPCSRADCGYSGIPVTTLIGKHGFFVPATDAGKYSCAEQ